MNEFIAPTIMLSVITITCLCGLLFNKCLTWRHKRIVKKYKENFPQEFKEKEELAKIYSQLKEYDNKYVTPLKKEIDELTRKIAHASYSYLTQEEINATIKEQEALLEQLKPYRIKSEQAWKEYFQQKEDYENNRSVYAYKKRRLKK